MIPRSAPTDSRLLLEVVDRHNRPVCHMPQTVVLKQHLLHRSVGLFVRSARQTLLVRCAQGWDLFAREPVPAGMAMQEAAESLALRQGLGHLPLRELRTLPPLPTADEQAFMRLYAIQVSPARLRALAVDPERHLLLDRDELYGIARHNGDLLSPLLRQCLPLEPLNDTPASCVLVQRSSQQHP